MTPIQIGGTIAGCIIWVSWIYLVIRLAYPAIVSHHKRKRHRAAFKRFMNRDWE